MIRTNSNSKFKPKNKLKKDDDRKAWPLSTVRANKN